MLTSIGNLKVRDDFIVQLLVVDNSVDGNAYLLVDRMRAKLPWQVDYFHEVRSGISFARNAALDQVMPRQFDFMVGLDDDMHVDPDWLVELISVATQTDAEAVISCRKFEYSGVMSWWVDGAYQLDHRKPVDGLLLNQGHTGGYLVKLDCVRSLNLRFDEDLGKSGGEDTLFFDRILSEGGRVVYAEKAISYEVLGSDRARVRWWLKRWYRTGNTSGLVALASDRSTRLRVLFDGFIRVFFGVAGTIISLPWLLRRRATGMRAVRMLCRGSGYVAAALGSRYEEYAQDGRTE